MVADLEAYDAGDAEIIEDEETRLYYERAARQRETELAEYDRLTAGLVTRISGEGPNSLGAVITKARIARGMTLADLGDDLQMSLQQVQRYESEGWLRASLWRLQRVADVLGLRVAVEAVLQPPAQPPPTQQPPAQPPAKRSGRGTIDE
jgi:ribosome-binding protein aMBF1 (putative translation factor)